MMFAHNMGGSLWAMMRGHPIEFHDFLDTQASSLAKGAKSSQPLVVVVVVLTCLGFSGPSQAVTFTYLGRGGLALQQLGRWRSTGRGSRLLMGCLRLLS